MVNKIKMIAEPGKQAMFIVRELDAPRELVFKAFYRSKALFAVARSRRLKPYLKSSNQKMAEATDL